MPDELLALPQSSGQTEPNPALDNARSLLPVIIVGLAVVLVALLMLQWPTPQPDDSPIATTLHPNRLAERLNMRDMAGLLIDIVVYALVLAVIGLMARIWRQGRRDLWGAVMVVALLGLAYTGGMALYTGPIVGVCGFTLILFGALAAWAGLPAAPQDDRENAAGNTEIGENGEHVENIENVENAFARPEKSSKAVADEVNSGNNDYASHPVA